VFIRDLKVPVYGAFLNGKNIHSIPLKKPGGFLIMGNESLGIGQEISKLIDHKISIPQYGQAESLNVAIATAVICDNFRRKEEEFGAR
jgi:TrmH family RNA methyltransferase